jgi:PPIC-type PPIASE domain
MKRMLLAATVALMLGVATGEFLTRDAPFRRWIARVAHRGELETLVGRRGIYDTDLERAWQAEVFARGGDPQEIERSIADQQKRALLPRLIVQARLDAAAAGQPILPAALAHEMDVLRWQFRNEKAWAAILQSVGLNLRGLRREAATNLRDRQWIEAQIASRIQPNEAECRRYFDAHRRSFQEPLRFRASHLFLAAPDGYPAEVIATKRTLSDALSRRLANGESFPALVAEFSEDDATNKRGGDLGYFAEERMLPAVFQAAQKLSPGEISVPVRSRLGFHIIRLTELRPARALSFEEARPEISARLENQQRASAVADLIAARQ